MGAPGYLLTKKEKHGELCKNLECSTPANA